MTTRRDFLRGLLSLGATAAAGVAIVEPEPVRRFWQVGRGAPVGDLPWTREYLFGVSTATYPQWAARAIPIPASAIDDHAAHIRAHMEMVAEGNARAFGKTETHRQAVAEHIAEHLRMWQQQGVLPLDPYLDAKARYGHEAAELQPFVPIDPTPQPQRYDFPVVQVGSREIVIDPEGARDWFFAEPIHTARITRIKS